MKMEKLFMSKISAPYIAVERDKYKSDEDTWKAISDVCKVLIENENQILLTYEDCGIYRIDYEHDPCCEDWGSDRFMYVTADESADILEKREYSEEN